MKQRVGAVALALVAFVLALRCSDTSTGRDPPAAPGAGRPARASRASGPRKPRRGPHGDPLRARPLWAYGFDRPPAPGEMAAPQNPPNRNLRPGQDPVEQTRPRHLEGSSATYSLVDIRDGQNVIDWFPGDHPPMPDVVRHGPARLGATARGCASCHLPNGKGRAENAAPAAPPIATSSARSRIFETACDTRPIRESRTPTR